MVFRRQHTRTLVTLALVLIQASSLNHAYELVCQPEGMVTSLAGSGVPGFRDGLKERAFLHQPTGVAVDTAGVVYVSDSGNNRIRRMSVDGIMTTIAGSGSAGFADDTLSRAEFNNPQAIVLTPDGLLFVADCNNHRIRLIDMVQEQVLTYAGAGISDYRDAVDPAQAYIRSPVGLAYHTSTGDLYVSDGDSRIRVVRGLGGMVETVLNGGGTAGFSDAVGLSAVFNSPSHMTMNDDETVLYVADRRNNRIRSVDLLTLTVTTVAGTEASPESGGTLASNGATTGNVLPGSQGGIRFNHPFGIAFYLEPRDVGNPSGNATLSGRPALLVTEIRSHRLRRIILDGNVSGSADATVVSFAYAGSYNSAPGHSDGLGPACLFDGPTGIAILPGAGGRVAFVADAGNNLLRRVTREIPTQVHVDIVAVDNAYFASGANSGYPRDLVLESYGYYSVNGPPNNETTHLHGSLTFIDESHDLTMCVYPSSEYFLYFKGSIQVTVWGEEKSSLDVVSRYTYLVWTGKSAQDERSENFQLRGGGCTDPSAPNFNVWASYDDGSCVAGTTLELEISAMGSWGMYQVEGPGFYYGDELASRQSGIAEDDLHFLKFTAWPQAVYTIQLHGALRVLVTDAPNQATTFTYLNYTSDNEGSHHIEVIRPAGSGCTQNAFINYSPFATSEDNSCMEGSLVQFDSTAATFDSLDWYGYGYFGVLEPLLLGGHAVISPIRYSTANSTSTSTAYVIPGTYSINMFGNASAQVFLDESDAILLNVDGSNSAMHVDAHGFPSTLGNAVMYFTVPENAVKQQVVSDAGGVVGNTETGSVVLGAGALETPTVIGIAVAELSNSAVANLRNDGGAGSNGGSWDIIGKVFQVNPLRLRLAFPVTISIPFEESNQPAENGNSNMVVLRASDEQASDWRVVSGASFSAGNAFVELDYFSLLTVAARAEVRAITPARAITSGGTAITLDGVNFRGVPVSSAEGNIFCKFGDVFKKAEFVRSQEIRGFGEAVMCPTPAISEAKFTTVEIHDAGTLLSSDSRLQILITAAADITSSLPPSGPASGGTLVFIFGSRLSAGASNIETSRVGDLGGPGTRSRDDITCFFGGTRSDSNGLAISSALAICEVPDGHSNLQLPAVGVSLSSHSHLEPTSARYQYRAALNLVSSEDESPSISRVIRSFHGTEEGGIVVDVHFGEKHWKISEDVNHGPPEHVRIADLRCMFGSVSVSSRFTSRVGEKLQCMAPARSGSRRRRNATGGTVQFEQYSSTICPVHISGSPGEPMLHVADFTYLPVVHHIGAMGSDPPEARADFSDVSPHADIARSLYTSHHGGFVAVSLSSGTFKSPSQADLRPLIEYLSPGKHNMPFVRAAGGGPTLTGGGGGILWLAGGNLSPYGIVGSWKSHDVAGIDLGMKSVMMCRFGVLGIDFNPHNPMTNTHKRSPSPILESAAGGHIVSSALVACEPPTFLPSHEGFNNDVFPQREYVEDGIEVRVGVTSDLGTESVAGIILRMTLEPILTSVSPLSGIPSSGGSTITTTWHAKAWPGFRFPNPHLSCAFGTIAPISLMLLGGESEAGSCVTPAHAPTPEGSQSKGVELLPISLHLQSSGRLACMHFKFDAIVRTTPIQRAFLTSSIYTSSGKVLSVSHLLPLSAKSCNFGMDISSTLHPVSPNMAVCFTTAMRGGFVTVRISGDQQSYGGMLMGQIEVTDPPLVKTLMPSIISSTGGTIMKIVGFNLHSSCQGLGCMSNLFCTYSVGATSAALMISSSLALCEVPSHAASLHQHGANTDSGPKLKQHETLFTISRGSQDPLQTGIGIRISESPNVSITVPGVATADAGGDLITVHGINFDVNFLSPRCVFGTISVAAAILNETRAECVSPSHAASCVPFAISHLGDWGSFRGDTVVTYVQ